MAMNWYNLYISDVLLCWLSVLLSSALGLYDPYLYFNQINPSDSFSAQLLSFAFGDSVSS